MTAPSATTARPASTSSEVRLGSFLIGHRIDDAFASQAGVVVLEAIGAKDSSFADRAAIVRCLPPTAIDTSADSHAKSMFARLRGLNHASIAPILEVGIAAGTMFIAEARPTGARLSDHLRLKGKLSPAKVRRLVADLGAALGAMHSVDLPHGWISPTTIWVSPDGATSLSGFVGSGCGSVTGQGKTRYGQSASEDQLLLAHTTYAALTGEPFRVVPRLSTMVVGIPSVVTSVLARATADRSADRFPGVRAFADAFDAAIVQAGDDLIAGVWEATARGDVAMGNVMYEMAASFAPAHPDLAVLRARLNGGDIVGQPMTGGSISLNELVSAQPRIEEIVAPGVRTAEEEAAIAALLTVPKFEPKKSSSSPWIGFAIGVLICLLLLVVVAAATIVYS